MSQPSKLVLHAALNQLSFGNVSYNVLRELYRRQIQVVLIPRSGNADLSAFSPDPQFAAWIQNAITGRYRKIDRTLPTLNIWHIRDSEFKPTDRQFTLSFHETDSATDSEVNILNQQEHTFFTSNWSVNTFKTYGVKNVSYVPLGLDEDFTPLGQTTDPAVINWHLGGKAEPLRKLTAFKIQSWIKKYGGQKGHMLNLCVTNPFFRPEDMNAFYGQVFGGSKPWNVNIIPFMKTNREVNATYNACQLDLSGFSRGEGYNLPAFNMTALGKWSIISNCSAHKDWATKDNAVLIEPKGMVPAVDGMFFHPNAEFSSGNMYDFNMDDFVGAMEQAEKLARTPNIEGLKLARTHTYKRTVDEILAKIAS